MGSEILLVLSLLSGYLFIHSVHVLRYRAQSLNGTRLLFETAAAGLPFLIVSRFLVLALPFREEARGWWIPFAGGLPWSATVLVALAMAILLAFSTNLAVEFLARWREVGAAGEEESEWFAGLLAGSRRLSLDWAVSRYGNALQKAQHEAATRWDEGILLEVTLSCRRLYTGFVMESPALTPNDGYLELLAVMSGHRRADDLRTVYDHRYLMTEAHAEDDPALMVRVVVPVAEIQVVRLLDFADLQSLDRQLEAEAPGEQGESDAVVRAGRDEDPAALGVSPPLGQSTPP